jgi:hypothetical protein
MGTSRTASRTLLREAEEEVDLAKATGEVPLDSVFVIEKRAKLI